jgi:hypothetical protein
MIMKLDYMWYKNIIADINNGCKVNVDYKPPEDDLCKG